MVSARSRLEYTCNLKPADRLAVITYLRLLSRISPIVFRPSAGIMSAPMPNSSTKGATLVISEGTSWPSAPRTAAAFDTADCLGWLDFPVAVLVDEALEESALAGCSVSVSSRLAIVAHTKRAPALAR